MVPSGSPTPIGSGQSVPPPLLRSNSGMLGAQGASMASQTGFSSLVSPRTHYNNVNILGNVANISPLLNQSFGNGVPNSGLSSSVNNQRGGLDPGAEPDPLGSGMSFNVQSSFMPSNSNQVHGNQFSSNSSGQMLADQQQSQSDAQGFQHGQQLAQQHGSLLQQQQHQFRGGLGGVGAVKLEAPVAGEQQQAQSLRHLTQIKLEPQHISAMRSLAPVKMESQHADQSVYLHHQHQQQQQQQQQQQFLQMSRQSSQATAAQLNLLNQQRILQLQQHQQQQLLKTIPQQRSHLTQQIQQQNIPMRSAMKPSYEPGMCARRLTHYMYQQQHRPEDNNIEFWRKFVAEYFAPHAKKKGCFSMYGSGRQTTGVFPQDAWHCEICNRKPGRGFEATVEVLPRLFKIKYESGTLEELLYVDMPHEHQNLSGQIVLDYAKAIQESVFEQLRVVREGQLRIVFSPELKICSWEFCARRHEELIPRRLLIPQVGQLGAAAQKYTQNASSNSSLQELQNNCNMFVASARQLAKALEVPLVNDLGYTKRYVRCLQISEVVNSMKDLIDYSRETGTGPMESLAKFPRRSSSSLFHNQAQSEEQQTLIHNTNSEPSSLQGIGMASVNNSVISPSASSSTSAIAGLLHQNSMNSRLAISSPGTSNIIASPASGALQQPALSGDGDNVDSQSSVQKLIHEMLMSNQLGGSGMMGIGHMNEVKNVNGNRVVGNGSFGGLPPSAMMNGRMGMNHPQQDFNGLNNLPYDWKSSS